jgi:hypothetical protein
VLQVLANKLEEEADSRGHSVVAALMTGMHVHVAQS